MGDMADYYGVERETWVGWPSFEADPPRVTRASKWTTRDGQKIAIRDMTTEHLNNVLKMYEQGRLQLPDTWLFALKREVERRK